MTNDRHGSMLLKCYQHCGIECLCFEFVDIMCFLLLYNNISSLIWLDICNGMVVLEWKGSGEQSAGTSGMAARVHTVGPPFLAPRSAPGSHRAPVVH